LHNLKIDNTFWNAPDFTKHKPKWKLVPIANGRRIPLDIKCFENEKFIKIGLNNIKKYTDEKLVV
jgi:hypothetical protein